MLYCVTQENNYYLGSNLLIAQHKLRYQAIIERQFWDVPSLRSMEYDQYDNLASVYIVKTDAHMRVQGTARLCPTTRPYMLKDIFSHLVTGPLPAQEDVWEGSRFCVDKALPAEERKLVQQSLVYGYLEFALSNNIKSIIGVMHPAYWRNLFARNGWPIEPLGNVHKVPDGKDALAASLNITPLTLTNVQKATGFKGSLLQYSDVPERKIA